MTLILLFLPFSAVSPYRWILLLTYPFAFYATDALSMLKSIKWKSLKINLRKIAILYLILSTAILSFGFIFMNPENPFIYYKTGVNSYLIQIPTSMLQNTVSVTDCKDTANALQWFKNNENSSAILLTHQVFYGWALLTLNSSRVVLYGFDTPLNASVTLSHEGFNQLYVIWWINGKGWEGQPTLSSVFHEIYQSGEIAIYRYVPN